MYQYNNKNPKTCSETHTTKKYFILSWTALSLDLNNNLIIFLLK